MLLCSTAHSVICTRLFRGKMHSDLFDGIEILQGRWQHGEKVGYSYPSGLEKTLCESTMYRVAEKSPYTQTIWWQVCGCTRDSTRDKPYPKWWLRSGNGLISLHHEERHCWIGKNERSLLEVYGKFSATLCVCPACHERANVPTKCVLYNWRHIYFYQLSPTCFRA
jgi:hypothetical protein